MRRSLIALFAAGTLFAQQAGDIPVFRAESNLVILNVFARSKDGKNLENLTANDFTVTEDGKPQKISVFEYQRLDGSLALPIREILLCVRYLIGIQDCSPPGT
jgi:hypothetical protein